MSSTVLLTDTALLRLSSDIPSSLLFCERLMSRQPLLPQYKAMQHFFIGGHSSLDERPEHAVKIGQCITAWSAIESQMAITLAAILKTKNPGALALFLSLQNARSKREGLAAAASVTLQGEELDAFDALLSIYGSVSKLRVDLAHGIFGHTNEYHDILLWVDAATHAIWITDGLMDNRWPTYI